jgi:hypothetical protein
MKITERSNFRVEVTFRARQLSDLGLTGVQGQIIHGDLSCSIAPQRLGNFGGGISMSDARVSNDIAGDYERRCNELLDEIRRQRPVATGQVVWTEEHLCSFCKIRWEVMTPEYLADRDLWPDEHTVEGEPVCCDKAIAEFRIERGIPALADEVTSGGAAR